MNGKTTAVEPQRHTSPIRNSEEHSDKGSCDEVAQRVLNACRKKDDGAQIVYVGRNDHDQTIVRVRAGNACSVGALQTSMQQLFPFARVRTSENVLNGALFAEVTVPTSKDEWDRACLDASNRLGVRAMKVVAFACLVSGAALYVRDLTV